MNAQGTPTYVLFRILGAWLIYGSSPIIDYLHAENKILERQLAVKGRAVGRKVCVHRNTGHHPCVAPTIGRFEWTFRRRTLGRPPIADEVRVLIVELARTDSNWGYTSIRVR